MATVAVIGSGAWGSALACVSARAGHETRLWGRDPQVVSMISGSHRNPAYLGDLALEPAIVAHTSLRETLASADFALLAIPAQSLASTLELLDGVPPSLVLVTTCKGIDRASGLLPTQLAGNALPDNPVAALSGPSFAVDVVQELPTAVTIAAHDEAVSRKVAETLSGRNFRCYSSRDVLGVELGGALKNVLALAVGAARGMGLGASAEAALIARGFAEITRLSVALGAQPETLTGLSGLGDMVLTCSSPQSRNFTFGMALGTGEDVTDLKLAEGAFTAGIALQIANRQEIEVPITEAIVAVLESRMTAREAVGRLLTRPLKRET